MLNKQYQRSLMLLLYCTIEYYYIRLYCTIEVALKIESLHWNICCTFSLYFIFKNIS